MTPALFLPTGRKSHTLIGPPEPEVNPDFA